MPDEKWISTYLDQVASQIRWKRARPVVTEELRQHLEDQRDAFADQGREEPARLAVEEMGDPVAVGMELDRIHRPQNQWGLMAATVLMAACGGLLRVMLGGPSGPALFRTVLGVLLGCGVLLAVSFWDYRWLGRYPLPLYGAALAVGMLLLLFSPRLGGAAYYARYAVLCYPAVFACWLYGCRGRGWLGLAGAVLGLLPLSLVCLWIPDLFSFLLLAVTGSVLCLLAAWEDWFGLGHMASILPVLLCAVAAAAPFVYTLLASPYVSARLEALRNPEADLSGAGYLTAALRQAVGGARWLGEGAGGTEAVIPNWDGDGLLVALICRAGWLPFLLLTAAFAALMLWLLYRCVRHQNRLGRLLTLAVVIPLFLQALCSVAWTLGFPLFSASFPLVMGNLNTVLDMALIGLALSVFREAHIARDVIPLQAALPRYHIKIVIEKV